MKVRQIGSAFRIFFSSQQSSGILLIACTLLSLGLANSSASAAYCSFWDAPIVTLPDSWHLPSHPLGIINDLLMAVFFLLVGLEIKREALSGELSSLQRASLPVAAAIGGMIVPAAMFWLFNHRLPSNSGWGIPMATDIAFAIGILSLLGNRVPDALKLLLTALAVADDLGAVLVIALFYTHELNIMALVAAGVMMLVLFLLNRYRVRSLLPYLLCGVMLWYFIHLSGIHATVAGVLLALMIPYDAGTASDPLQKLETKLHLPVSRFILPLFALANTALLLEGDPLASLQSPLGIGILAGLVIGKPVGISLAILLAVRIGWSKLPEGMGYRPLIGAGMLGGIGFTMSIFITLLAFNDPSFTGPAKISILAASTLSGIIGFVYLNKVLPSGKDLPR